MSDWYPELIPIERIEDYHTHFLGETKSGKLFFGYETFVFPNGFSGGTWEKERHEYAILYLFDKEGNHIDTKLSIAGITSDIDSNRTRVLLEELIYELGELEFKDIKVKPFRTNIDGIEFGLIPNEEIEMIELQPSSTISFSEPWDGDYDT